MNDGIEEETTILRSILEDILGRALPNPPECNGCHPESCMQHNDCHFLIVMSFDYLSLRLKKATSQELINHFENSAAIHESGILVEPITPIKIK